jgi:hypothetical protein
MFIARPKTGVLVVCGKALFFGTLAGNPADPRLVWLIGRDGTRIDVDWPEGFRVAFHPALVVLAPDGSQVATGGQPIQLGGAISDRTNRLDACEVNGRDWFGSS